MNDSLTKSLATAEPTAWPSGVGEMAERIRAHDWAATPLGPIDTWPQSLRTVVDLMLNASQPTYIAWGPDHTLLYNDALIPILGGKHPGAIGASFSRVWAEIWDEYRPIIATTIAGEAQHFVDRPVALDGRPGRPMSWFTFSWTPLRDEMGIVRGLYCAATETTDKVADVEALRESKEAALRESEARYRTLLETIDEGFCVIEVLFDDREQPVDYRFIEVNRAFEAHTGLGDAVGKTIKSLNPTHETFWFEVYGKVARTGEPIRLQNAVEGLGRWFEVYAIRVGRPDENRVAVLFNDITARRLAEKALSESEARYSAALTIARLGTFEWNLITNEILLDDRSREIFGFAPGEGRNAPEIFARIDPEQFPRVREEARASADAMSRLEIEYHIHWPDGTVRTIVSISDALPGPYGTAERLVGVFDDITERKHAEARLRASEARLSQVQKAARIGSFEFDRTTGAATASREFLDLYGLRRDLSGAFGYEDWLALVHPDDRPWVEAETQAAVADPARTQLDYDFRIIRADNGEIRWIAARTRLLRDPDGRFIRSLGAQWDVTEENKAAAALRESEARFRHMADSAPALIWMTDADGKIVFANMHYEHVFGRAASAMLGDGWRDIVHPDDLPGSESAFLEAFTLREPFRRELRVHDRHGEVRWLRCEGVPRLDDTGHFLGFTGCNVDITEAKIAEERRDLLINELNHRVKNTLATVQSIASQTLRNAKTMTDANAAIGSRLFALSRAHDVLTRENWEGADLYEIVEQAVAPYSSRGEDRLHLKGPKVRLPPRTALSLAMMLQELATNAVKYGALSNATGEIRIAWEVGAEPAPRLHLRWQEMGGPTVQAPARRGFGTRLIERSLAQDLGGDVQIAFESTGVVCTLTAALG